MSETGDGSLFYNLRILLISNTNKVNPDSYSREVHPASF